IQEVFCDQSQVFMGRMSRDFPPLPAPSRIHSIGLQDARLVRDVLTLSKEHVIRTSRPSNQWMGPHRWSLVSCIISRKA
ncbi:uncharacterized protein METZ01_LOCUS504298, partial [marine metagenome]